MKLKIWNNIPYLLLPSRKELHVDTEVKLFFPSKISKFHQKPIGLVSTDKKIVAYFSGFFLIDERNGIS